jgi:DNA-binding transcriptional LysR family regulator
MIIMVELDDMLDHLDATNLVALHVLLEERHVTRAARRLGITQSSMSHRLARLRDALQDPLFVRSAGGLLPTPRAQSIAGPLAEALRALEAVVVPPERFAPATSRYTISIAMPDLLAPLASRLIAGLTSEAPLLHVRLSHVVPSLSEALARGEPALALAPSRFVDGPVIARTLGDVRFGVVGRQGHRALRGRLRPRTGWSTGTSLCASETSKATSSRPSSPGAGCDGAWGSRCHRSWPACSPCRPPTC